MRRICSRMEVRAAAHLCLLFGLLALARPLHATPSAAVALAWDPSTDPSVTGYNVYYGASSRTYTNVIPAGGATTAIVSNLASGVTYYFAATTYTAAGLESDYSIEAAYSVPAANQPPTLDNLTNVILAQDAGEQTIALTGITSGDSNEVQTLTVSAFSSNPGLIPSPLVVYSSPETTGSLTFYPVPGSYGSSVITVMVDDGGTVSNTVIRSFTVTVAPPDNPPSIDLLSDIVVTENAGRQTVQLTGISSGSTNANVALSIVAVSSNPSLIPNPTVNYVSPSSSGSLSFTPTTNSFGTARITIAITDNQPTNNYSSVSFQVTVNQAVPVAGLLASAVIAPNSTFRFEVPLPATNNDKVSVALAAGAPTGAQIIGRKGNSWLVWTPTMSQASSTNLIGIKITDSSNPALSTNEMVQVIVEDYLALTIGSASVQAGQSGSVWLGLSSSDGVTNLSFTVPWPATALANPSLSISAAGVAASSLRMQGSNVVVSLQMSASQVLQNSNLLGTISFQSQTTQPSGYLSLPIASLAAVKPSSQPYATSFPTAGQVAIVNNLAMLQAKVASGPSRSLNVLGKVGNTYQLQYATNFGPGTIWAPLLTYSQTNISQNISVDPATPNAFYRVQQK